MSSENLIEALSTQGWYIWDDFLTLEHIKDIKQSIPQTLSHARIGNGELLAENKAIRGDKIIWLTSDMGEPIVVYMDKMEQLRQALNQALYLGLCDFETHYCCYPSGAFYKQHVDNFQGKGSRKITTVLYLNEQWQSGDGGELAIYNMDNSPLITVEPIAGRLIVFISENFPHEVLTTQIERHSIAGWFLTQKVF